MRILRLLAAFIMTTGVTVGAIAVGQAPAQAACSYYDYGTVNPTAAASPHYGDPYIWISLRRQADTCKYYAVVRNLRATGRDGCTFYVTSSNGSTSSIPCPAAGSSASTPVIGGGPNLQAQIFYTYSDQTDFYPSAGNYSGFCYQQPNCGYS